MRRVKWAGKTVWHALGSPSRTGRCLRAVNGLLLVFSVAVLALCVDSFFYLHDWAAPPRWTIAVLYGACRVTEQQPPRVVPIKDEYHRRKFDRRPTLKQLKTLHWPPVRGARSIWDTNIGTLEIETTYFSFIWLTFYLWTIPGLTLAAYVYRQYVAG